MEPKELKAIIECLIFVSPSPLSLDKICGVIDNSTRNEIKEQIDTLIKEYQDSDRGFTLEEVAQGYHFRTKKEYADWIKKLYVQRSFKFSRAALETLAIIAYKQPIIRPDIEHIRGVDCGSALKTLLDKKLIKIIARKDVPGRPLVYGTTSDFLEVFGLKDLTGLPTLEEIEEKE